MNAVAQAMTPAQGTRGPIKGTLSDADVKHLIVRAAKAKSIFEVHAIIKIFCQNRVALTKVIEQLQGELKKSRSAVSSQFDIALLDQLKVVRTELDEAYKARDAALNDMLESSEKLHRMEQLHDNAQRLAERVQRELLLANMEREQLYRQNMSISDELNQKSETLLAISEEVAELRDRLLRTEAALSETIEKGSKITAERDALRQQLFTATGDVSELRKKLGGFDRLVADLRAAVRKHVHAAAEDKKMIHFLSAEVMSARFKQRSAQPAAPAMSAEALANVVATNNVVPFASNGELERLRQQVKLRDTAIAGKDSTITQLTSANGAMKNRLSEIETRANQVDAAIRAQALANETLANQLLEMLPDEQRAIYSRPSHDASSLVLITNAVKRHVQEQNEIAQFNSGNVGHTM